MERKSEKKVEMFEEIKKELRGGRIKEGVWHRGGACA